jgi:hypothetical protein
MAPKEGAERVTAVIWAGSYFEKRNSLEHETLSSHPDIFAEEMSK